MMIRRGEKQWECPIAPRVEGCRKCGLRCICEREDKGKYTKKELDRRRRESNDDNNGH